MAKTGREEKKVKPKKAKAAAKRKQQNATQAKSKRDRRVELFTREYIVDFNGRAAAIRAGYAPTSARFEASRLLALPDVQAKVEAAMDERLRRAQLDGDQVLARIRAIATADPNDLIEIRRTCCRYCYGKGHRYQRTPQELKLARQEFEAKIDEQYSDAMLAAQLKAEFDEEGGIGWDPRKEPADDCPECFGEGQFKEFVKDTRELKPEARLLYRGVKVTQQGFQILMADQDAMLRLLGEHAGLFRRKMELTGKDGAPIDHRHQTIGSILDDLAESGADTGPGPSS